MISLRLARLMLATALFLLPPALERVFSHYVPGLRMDGPQDFAFFRWDLHFTNMVCVAIAFALYRQAPRYGRAFAVTAGVMVLQSVGFETIGQTSAWSAAFMAFGSVRAPIVVLIGLAIGMAITWAGWTIPLRFDRSRQPAASA